VAIGQEITSTAQTFRSLQANNGEPFDFGLKHIGVAIGQEITSTAQTFRSLQANNGEPDWNILDILIKEWKPKLFVVGNPLNMDGSDSERLEYIRYFD